MISTEFLTDVNLNSKRFKTLKNIILTFKGRELLVYPYPIFISPNLDKDSLKDEYELEQATFFYKGVPLYFFFLLPYRSRPMFLRTRWEKLEELPPLVEEAEECTYKYYLSEHRYDLYFWDIIPGLKVSAFSFFYYKIYCEMFDQSQLILKNMELEKEDFFDGVKDIVIDISESPYLEEFKAAKEMLNRWPIRINTQSFYKEQTFKYGLEESKSILINHLGETSPFGYSGVDENFFKRYDYRHQLAIIYNYHQLFIYDFASGLCSQLAILQNIGMLNFPPSSSCVFMSNSLAITKAYVRSLHRKLRLFLKG